MRLIDLVKMHPEKEWDRLYLSQNRAISVQEIIDNPQCPWNYECVIQHHHECSIKHFKHMEFPEKYCFYLYSKRHQPNAKDLEEYKEKLNWFLLSQNVYPHVIIKNPSLPWMKTGLQENVYMNISILKALNLENDGSFRYLNPDLTHQTSADEILERHNEEWNWMEVLTREDLTLEQAIKIWELEKLIPPLTNPSKNDVVNWFNNRRITPTSLEEVLKNPNKNWNMRLLSQNTSIKTIRKHKNLNWHWDSVALFCQDLTLQDVLEIPELQYEMGGVSSNDSIPLSDIAENPQLNWDYAEVSGRYYLSVNDIINFPQFPWDFVKLSINTFNYDILKNEFFEYVEKFVTSLAIFSNKRIPKYTKLDILEQYYIDENKLLDKAFPLKTHQLFELVK